MLIRVGVCLPFISCAFWGPPAGGQAADKSPMGDWGDREVSGIVVDSAGRPVGDATVWLVGNSYDEPNEPRDQTRTDARGRFAFKGRVIEGLFADLIRRRFVLARDASNRLGWSGRLKRSAAADLRVELREVADARGRVVDVSGDPIAGARIEINRLGSKGLGDKRGQTYAQWPSGVVDESDFAPETGADGVFALRNVPTSGSVYTTVTADGYCKTSVLWTLPKTVTITLERAYLSVSGSLEFDADVPQSIEGIKLYLQSTRGRQSRNDGDPRIFRLNPELTLTPDGAFRVEGLAPGKYSIHAQLASTAPCFAEPTDQFDVQSGTAVTGIVIPVRKAFAVRGRVVDRDSSRGIENAAVYIRWIDETGMGRAGRGARTDAEGRYVIYTKPGRISVWLARVPETHLPAPSDQRSEQKTVSSDIEWPDIFVVPAVSVAGVVVDDSGRPVPGAPVHVAIPEDPSLGGRRFGGESAATADRNGEFVVSQLNGDDSIPFRTRTRTAVTDGAVIITPNELEGKLKLVVSEKNAFRLRGRVMDASGGPVSDALVSIQWHVRFTSRFSRLTGFRPTLDTLRTDEHGRYESDALWPGDEYELRVSADGFTRVESSKMEGAAGLTREMDDIVLERTSGSVAGRVVDSAGGPLADVRVFNVGDAAKPLSTTTGADGRFHLDGLTTGSLFVFAEKSGFRFTGVRAETERETTITLPAEGETAPPSDRMAGQISFSQQKEIARRLLERIWKTPGVRTNRSDAQQAIRYMARIDPEMARAWSEETDGRHERSLQNVLVSRAADRDADQALAMLADFEDKAAVRSLVNWVRRLSEPNPTKALRFAEEAAVRARGLDDPLRSELLAEIGSLLVALDKRAAGRKLLDEAAAAAEGMDREGRDVGPRGRVALAVAHVDIDRALSLIESMRPTRRESPVVYPGREHYLGKIAISAATHDPERAAALLEQVDDGFQRDQLARSAAYYAGRIDAKRAVQIADGIGGPGYRALAYGWVAVAVAPRDRALAQSLIDKAFDTISSGDLRSWSNYGGSSVFAARLVYQATQVGYPHIESLVARTLSLRMTLSDVHSEQYLINGHARTAMVLALTDSRTARQMLIDLAPRRARHKIERFTDNNKWFSAWALSDPVVAYQLASAVLDRQVTGGEVSELWRTGVLNVANLLTTPPNRRYQPRGAVFLNMPFWFPGREH